jgi:3-dehydroquinate synthase
MLVGCAIRPERNHMPQTLPVSLGDRSYEIVVQTAFDGLGERIRALEPTRLAVIADQTVADLYGAELLAELTEAGLRAELIPFQPGEEAKCLRGLEILSGALLSHGLDRKSVVVALGGGVTGDLAGFVAASYMRGVRFVQVPTTLLAQVDSSVGGKTGVNLPGGKNLVGAFHQPSLVWINIRTLQSLPPRQFACGMAEVVKHGVIRDADYFAFVEEEQDAIQGLEADALEHVVAGSCRIKAAVVAEDEREGGVRAILNFGHTVGHAVETLTGYGTVTHGEAVSLGMVAAARLSASVLGMPAEDVRRIVRLLDGLNLPVSTDRLEPDEALRVMHGDKKAAGGTLRFALSPAIGRATVHSVEDTDLVGRVVESLQQPPEELAP